MQKAHINELMEMFIESNFFSPENYDEFANNFAFISVYKQVRRITIGFRFLSFYKFAYDTEEYLNFFKNQSTSVQTVQRELPDYKSVLLFEPFADF